jgi:pimeloyl-ACP methyl ester carboxylesterase
MRKAIQKILLIILSIYIIVIGLLYFFQERLIFFPVKLEKEYKFSFNQTFEEINIKMIDNVLLNGILFKADTSKGLIFYLHGNAGSLDSWGEIAKSYTDLHYDLFILDYRGYGKSDGRINGQDQIFQDIQTVYNNLKLRYKENKIIVLGYSLGTGLAAKLASSNNPSLLILQAPYFSLKDLVHHDYPIIPTFILKYKLETNLYIKNCKMPIVIFHGDADKIIYYKSSIKLKELIKPNDRLFILDGQGHDRMSDNPVYQVELKNLLKY